MKKLFNPALEAINFQTGAFRSEMISIYGDMRAQTPAEMRAKDNPVAADLARCVKHYTGLSVAFNIADDEPSVWVPQITRNNVLIPNFYKKYYDDADGKKLIKDAEGGVCRGTVNIKTGKVTGAFQDITSIINMPVGMIKNQNYTLEELTAITLHECGHVFTYYEYLSRSVTTNQVLAGLARSLDGTEGPAVRESVIMSAKTALGLNSIDPKELAKTKDNSTISIVIVTAIIKETASELGSDIYDLNNFEFLSDQFATRQGAGRDLVTGLDKLHRQYGDSGYHPTWMFVIGEILKLTVIIGSIMLIGAVAVTAGAAPAFGALFMTLNLWTWAIGSSSLPTPLYDRTNMRFSRVRNQLVVALKDRGIDAERSKMIREDIAAIDLITDQVKDRQAWLNVAWTFIFKSQGTRLRTEKLQADLEKLATNNLFIKAAELKELIA